MTITSLHELAECLQEPVTFAKVFPDSRYPSMCIVGSLGAIMLDTKNQRFTWRRFGSIKKYLNFAPNVEIQLRGAVHACGLTFRPREHQRVIS